MQREARMQDSWYKTGEGSKNISLFFPVQQRPAAQYVLVYNWPLHGLTLIRYCFRHQSSPLVLCVRDLECGWILDQPLSSTSRKLQVCVTTIFAARVWYVIVLVKTTLARCSLLSPSSTTATQCSLVIQTTRSTSFSESKTMQFVWFFNSVLNRPAPIQLYQRHIKPNHIQTYPGFRQILCSFFLPVHILVSCNSISLIFN